MIYRSTTRFGFSAAKATILMSVVFLLSVCVSTVSAQRKFSRNYPAGQNVKLQLMNRSGTVTVEGWSRPEINITAFLDAPAANIEPQNLSGTIVVNLLRDNQGRAAIIRYYNRLPGPEGLNQPR